MVEPVSIISLVNSVGGGLFQSCGTLISVTWCLSEIEAEKIPFWYLIPCTTEIEVNGVHFSYLLPPNTWKPSGLKQHQYIIARGSAVGRRRLRWLHPGWLLQLHGVSLTWLAVVLTVGWVPRLSFSRFSFPGRLTQLPFMAIQTVFRGPKQKL